MTPGNWSALLLQVSVEVIVAIGMTILLVSGGFDLSVGSTFAIAGAVTAMAMVSGLPTILAIVIGLLLGTTIGFINGFIIARIGINPFVTTLAMMSIVRGMLLVITRGANISGLPADFRFIGEGHLFGVQNPILIGLFLVFRRRYSSAQVRIFPAELLSGWKRARCRFVRYPRRSAQNLQLRTHRIPGRTGRHHHDRSA